MSDELLSGLHLVHNALELNALRVLKVHLRALIGHDEVDARHAESVLAVDDLIRTRRLGVRDVVDTNLRRRVVRDNRRNDIDEVVPHVIVQKNRQLQRVDSRIERGIRGRERPLDDLTDREPVEVDANRAVLLLHPRNLVKRSRKDRLNLNRRKSAELRDRLADRVDLHRLLRDISAEIRSGCLRRSRVLSNRNLMLSHGNFPLLFLFPLFTSQRSSAWPT